MQSAEIHTKAGAPELEKKSPVLAHQLNEFFAMQQERFAERGIDMTESVNWAQDFATEFLVIRLDRADDLKKPELKRARELAIKFIGEGVGHFVLACMDGRIPLAVPMSHVPHVGGLMKTASGDFMVFLEGSRPGEVIIEEDSYKAQSVERILGTHEIIQYSFDSHMGCAARGGSEKTNGSIEKDGGLRKDIRRKIQLARGVEKIRTKLVNEGKKVADLYTQFFSYDPHDGSITMGLEMYAENVAPGVISDDFAARIQAEGLSEDVRSVLSEQGKIVDTWQFIQDRSIAHKLKSVVKPSDFRNRFAESMLANWEAITALYDDGKGEVYQQIFESLVKAYEQGGWTIGDGHSVANRVIAPQAIENKAKVMLKNLVTRWSIAQDKRGQDAHGHDVWPFAHHLEQGIVFTEGGFGPFRDLDMFAIYSQGEILNHAYLAIDIVRASRAKGAITDPMGVFEGEQFVHAPAPIMNKAIVRDMSEAGWKAVEQIDLMELFGNIDWDDRRVWKWGKEEISQILDYGFVNTDIKMKRSDFRAFENGVYEVFDRMRQMMTDQRFRSMLLSGQAMACHLIVDRDRRARLVVPMTPHVSLAA